MTPQKNMKASDVYHETEHFFASKASFEKAFPQIEQISIEVVETEGFEHVDFDAFDKIRNRHIYTNESLPGEFIDCKNPECRKGGLSIDGVFHKMISEKLTEFQGTESCQGYEGSPKGRKRHRDCRHQFHYKVKIKYREIVKTV
jgi:hypothetical protein